VRLVQPNLPEPPAWSEAVFRRAVDGYTTLTAAPASRPADLVVWPEGAIPESFNAYLAPGSEAAARIAASLRPGQRLLVGGVRIAPGPGGGFDDGLYFNTLAALRRGEAGLVLEGTYDKHHLVPFGEYMPLARLLGPLGLRKLVSVSADFTPGPRPRPLILPGLSLQPLICYEALFPGIAPSGRGPRPRAIVNISDDAWFGRHAGPWQHFNLASYRAIEEGLPMMRATPTGVTGMIDAYGRSEGRRLAPGAAGVVDARLPAALAPTVYARWRDAPFWLMVLGCAVAVLLARGGRKLAF
jgi:apolipoprotein N-acyltransferase